MPPLGSPPRSGPTPSGAFAFGPYRLDLRSKQLLRDGEPVVLAGRHFELLAALVSHAGVLVSKDDLIRAAWREVTVSDNSLAQAMSTVRAALDANDPEHYITTARRLGYRFVADVTIVEAAQDAELDAMLTPYRALLDGRAALETLARDRIVAARATFEQLLRHHRHDASVHIGLANACALHFESTRADAAPDTGALTMAITHAREACRLRPEFGEAWATLGFVLERTGDGANAAAALRCSVELEPDIWRHHLRLAWVGWGDERLRAARRTLELRPNPLACWLAATVFVARDALSLAERDVDAGLAVMPSEPGGTTTFPAVGLHWLKGLLCLARGDDGGAIEAFDRELALEAGGHLYAREMAANTWYAIGACRLRRGEPVAARAAFEEAIARVPLHPMAHAGLALLEPERAAGPPAAAPASMEQSLACAARLIAADDVPGAARTVAAALSTAPAGNAGWLIPIEPLLNLDRTRVEWTPVLATLGTRAA